MDATELGKLYERYGYFVQQRCLSLLRNAADADDALQEVFLRVQKYHRTLAGEPSLAWLYTIALRCCLDLAKRRGRELATESGALESANTRQENADADQRATVGAALRRMDPKTCEIGVLHYLDGYTQEEVATRTGYSRRTIGTKLKVFDEHFRAHD